MPLTFTIITSEKPRCLTKHFALKDGKLQKTSGGQMSLGTFRVQTVETLDDFAKELSDLRSNEALTYGIPAGLRVGTIVTKDTLEKMSDAERIGHIARSNDHFVWPAGPGIFMIDIDPPASGPALTKYEAISLVRKVAPELKDVPILWYPSSSSHLFTEDGKELTGLRGQRLYVPVTDARDIPALADALWARCWARGLGRIMVSKSGQILKRTIFDNAVYQPSRLDFAAGASTGDGLEQRRGAPEVV